MGEILLTIYLIGFAIILVVFTVSCDPKFTRWSDRLLVAFLAGLVWPLMVVLGIAMAIYERSGWDERSDLHMRKRHVVLHRLLSTHPDYSKSRDSARIQKKFVYDYLDKFYPEGISLLRNPLISRREFAYWVRENVNIPVHEHGLGNVEWYIGG